MLREELIIEEAELFNSISESRLRLFDATVLLAPQQGESGYSRYEAGHLPGAAFLDHAVLSKQQTSPMFMLLNQEELAAAIGNLGISNDTDVVLYSTDSMMWATRAWWILKYAGHPNVRVLNGGREGWSGELLTTENYYEPETFEPNLSPRMIADKEEVMTAINDDGVCTLNALPYNFYTGEADVPYAKNGHIAGSLSLSFEHMMNGHRLKPHANLAEVFSAYDKSSRIITYCGGGIAATLTASCARLIGFEDVGVYDGSMSEWLEEGLPTTLGKEPGRLN